MCLISQNSPLELIEKERVYHFVDVSDRRVVHAPVVARFGVQRALEHSSKDGGRYAAPVEV